MLPDAQFVQFADTTRTPPRPHCSFPMTDRPTAPSTVILGFDPGRDKCGVAICNADGTLLWHGVVPATEAIARTSQLCEQYAVSLVVLGNQTTADHWRTALTAALPDHLPLVLVDERNSTLEARDRYWQLYPPKGLPALIPQSLRSIPRPIDDIVALLLIERYQQTASPT